jgi:CheY-like chemotaxis protein
MMGPERGCPVLIVEDDPDLREMMCLLLEGEGFEPEAACDGADALHRLRSEGVQPDVVVLDLMMPRMDGEEFLQQQARDPALADIPVVVLSASARINTDLPAAAVLSKPLNYDMLVETLRAHCPQRS